MVFDVYLVDTSLDCPTGPQQIDVMLGPGGLQGAPALVGFSFSLPGLIASGEDPIPYTALGAGNLDAAQCIAKCSPTDLPTNQVVFTLRQNGVAVGTVTWAAGQADGVVVLTSSSYVRGDYFELVPPAIGDASFAGASLTFAG